MKDKTTKTIAMLIILLLMLTGCGRQTPLSFTEESHSRFNIIERKEGDYTIAVDTQTGVEYLFTRRGNVTVLVDHEGNPYIANGWRDYGN